MGRYTGLLPYFPFALFTLGPICWVPESGPGTFLALCLALYGVVVLLVHPNDFAGAPGFVGSRYLAAVYPAFLAPWPSGGSP